MGCHALAMRAYREVLAVGAVRNILLLGAVVRVPHFAGAVLLAVHVVETLHGSFLQAGALAMVVTVCVAISGPWRGRLVDRFGLRATIAPAIVLGAVCWSIAPFVGYLPLLILAAVAGLYDVPVFSVVRMAVIAATTERQRQPALALEAVSVEAAFMVGPVLGVAAAVHWSTTAALFGNQMLVVLAGVVLWVWNPALRNETGAAEPVRRNSWFRLEFVALCGTTGAAVCVLAASELTFVSAVRGFDADRWLGLVMAIWGLGSLLGGLLYGALSRPLPSHLLLIALGLSTLPMAVATGPVTLGITGFLAGLLCAPTLTATIDHLSRIVPEGGRGEAIGWYGASMTLGSALGSVLGGTAIELGGARSGFGLAGVFGVAVGVGLAVLVGVRAVTNPLSDAASETVRAQGRMLDGAG
ncbi:putative major facilitator superfamily transporter [Nocardia asteroides NBRC 15531]|uniref:Major facilitator superfamily transporter n=2 Tax=Nocardia asteroides TaxID=1824 RepID=U5E7Z0_NOCAS|nr:putative major facilitator superfamily transporter [Nocardia asteroides NBRC 15531]